MITSPKNDYFLTFQSPQAAMWVNYFRLTGDDPTATKRDNTVLALKKLQDTFVSFIRKHETDHLKKIVDDFEATRKKLEQDQVSQTTDIKTTIETARLNTRQRLGAWIYDGMEVGKKGATTTFSVKDQFEKLAKMEEKTAELLAGIDAKIEKKMDKKKAVLLNRLEQMGNEIKDWNMITKDANRGRATAIMNELKTLVNGTY